MLSLTCGPSHMPIVLKERGPPLPNLQTLSIRAYAPFYFVEEKEEENPSAGTSDDEYYDDDKWRYVAGSKAEIAWLPTGVEELEVCLVDQDVVDYYCSSRYDTVPPVDATVAEIVSKGLVHCSKLERLTLGEAAAMNGTLVGIANSLYKDQITYLHLDQPLETCVLPPALTNLGGLKELKISFCHFYDGDGLYKTDGLNLLKDLPSLTRLELVGCADDDVLPVIKNAAANNVDLGCMKAVTWEHGLKTLDGLQHLFALESLTVKHISRDPPDYLRLKESWFKGLTHLTEIALEDSLVQVADLGVLPDTVLQSLKVLRAEDLGFKDDFTQFAEKAINLEEITLLHKAWTVRPLIKIVPPATFLASCARFASLKRLTDYDVRTSPSFKTDSKEMHESTRSTLQFVKKLLEEVPAYLPNVEVIVKNNYE